MPPAQHALETLLGSSPSLQDLLEMLAKRVRLSWWWPATSPFEIAVGAILTQNTAWRNVEYSMAALRREGLLDAEQLAAADSERIFDLIRPSGFMTAKTRSLAAVSNWWSKREYAAHLLPTPELRAELLELPGVGPETGDDILLYAFSRPAMIWDAYARRFFTACGWQMPRGYEACRKKFVQHTQEFTAWELAVAHGLIVDGGKLARAAGGWDALLEQWAHRQESDAHASVSSTSIAAREAVEDLELGVFTIEDLPEQSFAEPGPLRDQLVAAVRSGTKTNTASLFDDYVAKSSPLPRLGGRSVVVDSQGNPYAIIETHAVRILPLAQVGHDHVVATGERHTSVAQWRAAQEEFWASRGCYVSDSTLVVLEEFAVLALL